MTFIVTERTMNGTVTMEIWTRGIEAPSFNDAKIFLKGKFQAFGDRVKVHQDDDLGLSYRIQQDHPFVVSGTLAAAPLEFIK